MFYNNIWVNITTKTPQNTVLNQQLNVELAKNNKGWLGTGMDDIFEHRILLYKQPVKFRKSGIYKVKFEQVMRENPLKHVMNVGLRVEKVKF